MKVAVVGSRRRHDEESIRAYIRGLPEGTEVVSGGCKGVDSWAVDEAVKRGLPTKVFWPDLSNCSQYVDYVEAYYARNKLVVEYADSITAFVSPDRTGGTENTVKWATELGKDVLVK